MVEFVMAVEDSFAVDIPDSDAEKIITPRILVDYLLSRLPTTDSGYCLSQRTFYKLRQATCAELGLTRNAIRPSSSLATLFPQDDREQHWHAVKDAIGASHWPKIGKARFLQLSLSPYITEFSELVGFVMERSPIAVKGADNLWTRAQVSEVVHRLIVSELGVTKYSEDSEFVRDMGIN